MALLKKQADLLKGNFYILEEPTSAPYRYLVGKLSGKKPKKDAKSGGFHTYDLKGVEATEPPSVELSKEMLLDCLKEVSGGGFSYELNLGPTEKSSYFNTFKTVKETMEKRKLSKAVLYTKASQEIKGFLSLNDFLSLVKTGLEDKKSGYLFAFYNADSKKALLGLTPEYILKTNEKGEMITTAVAGTKISGKEQLKWSEKLIKEHNLVMKGISDSLKGQVEWGDVYPYKYADLEHLRAEGEVLTKAPLAFLNKTLHPTPAVGCLPKNFLVDELGPKMRGFFGGYAECLSCERPFSLVTIRCFEWSEKKVQVCVGGGVLKESFFEKEWLELEKKLKTFKKIWGL